MGYTTGRGKADQTHRPNRSIKEVLGRTGRLSAEDGQLVGTLLESYGHLTALLKAKNTSLARLQKLLFGASTEKTDAVFGETGVPGSSSQKESPEPSGAANDDGDAPKVDSPPKRKGHGRKGADAYRGAVASLRGGLSTDKAIRRY
ncbi:MAG: hypothetical protein HUU20_25440 [Pirellulales bacterium]|nr:hypothetical protein [Pirellulales bacterium]